MATGLSFNEFVELRLEPPDRQMVEAFVERIEIDPEAWTGVVYLVADLEGALLRSSTRGPIGGSRGPPGLSQVWDGFFRFLSQRCHGTPSALARLHSPACALRGRPRCATARGNPVSHCFLASSTNGRSSQPVLRALPLWRAVCSLTGGEQ